ncbi:hypothetical protein C0J52_05274 [Blattella germanica]|nr:hypothetical protein C0J52_05274 [Blattella germanica]
MKGDPEWRMPIMDPLHEEKLVLEQTSSIAGITLDLTNATIVGLKTGTVSKSYLNLDTGIMHRHKCTGT